MGTIGRLLKLFLHYTTLLDNLNVNDLYDVYKYFSTVYLLQVQAQSLIDIMVRAASALDLEVEGFARLSIKVVEELRKRGVDC